MDLSGKRFGPYSIIRQLGRGGMGEVYEVEHRVLRKRYALKLLREDFSKQSESIRRFELEAEVMAKLEHPHIVRVDGFGETDGRLWLQMELVKGVEPEIITLGDYAKQRGGQIPQGEFSGILRQILEGLAFAHSKGVVHRDLKPGNILLEKDAAGALMVKISDFGLARVLGEDFIRSQAQISFSDSLTLSDEKTISDSPTLPLGKDGTSTRALLGTWVYMSPEQRKGDAADMRSDVYAVGVMCYRLLTGKELGRRAISEFGLDKTWDQFVDKALEPEPSARYANGQALLEAFAKTEKKTRRIIALFSAVVLVASAISGMFYLGVWTFKQAAPSNNLVSFTSQPTGLTVNLNSNAVLTVGATGKAPLFYQWRLNGVAIPGATNNSYIMPIVHAADAGDYAVAISNRYNTVTSAIATISVISAPPISASSPLPVIGRSWTNSLGMVFLPLTNTKLLISCFETRVQDFNEYRKATDKPANRPSFKQDRSHPVVNVSWSEAVAFCNWLTAKEQDAGQLGNNQIYRLPLRSEWCQTVPDFKPTNRFVWGDRFDLMPKGSGNVAKYAKEGIYTLPVGTFGFNKLGFADIVGNASEWLGDSSHMGDNRYIIGGAWDSEDDTDFQVTVPPQIPKSISREDVSFRCALDLDAKTVAR